MQDNILGRALGCKLRLVCEVSGQMKRFLFFGFPLHHSVTMNVQFMEGYITEILLACKGYNTIKEILRKGVGNMCCLLGKPRI